MVPAAMLSAAELARARRWLASGAPAQRRSERVTGGAGYLWVAAGATLVALAAGAVLMTPDPQQRLRVVVDPADVGQ
jgi:hypothetical protein